jgi:RNA polymerase sigma-70 factor (ECF subfamily)
VRLALLAAITHLPPRQRAALVLYDVFRWPATDVAGLLGTTTASVTSAVQRARETLSGCPGLDRAAAPASGPDDEQLLDRYLDAFRHYDLDALTTLERAAC